MDFKQKEQKQKDKKQKEIYRNMANKLLQRQKFHYQINSRLPPAMKLNIHNYFIQRKKKLFIVETIFEHITEKIRFSRVNKITLLYRTQSCPKQLRR